MIWALEPSCTNPRNFRLQPADQVTMARVNLTDSISAFRACFNLQLLVISFHLAEFIRLFDCIGTTVSRAIYVQCYCTGLYVCLPHYSRSVPILISKFRGE